MTLEEISAEELKRLLDLGKVVALNPLNDQNYSEAHIPGSKHVQVNLVSREDFERRVAEIIPDKKQPVVVYCWGIECPTSGIAGEKLKEMGYEDVREYKGGVTEWHRLGLPLEGTDLKQLDGETHCRL